MKMHQTTHCSYNELTIRVPSQLQQHAQQVAVQQGKSLSDIVCLAISSYITEHSKRRESASHSMGLEEARQLMHTFGQGLGEGDAPHDAARHHDVYLYRK